MTQSLSNSEDIISSTFSKLKNTYNVSILDNETKELQDGFFTAAELVKNTEKDNTIYKLIRNYYKTKNGKLNSPKYISGPFNILRYYSEQYNMDIYLFGEKHAIDSDCPEESEEDIESTISIEKFFENLLETTSSFLDIYLEVTPFINLEYTGEENIEKQQFIISSLFRKLKTCIQTKTRESEKLCELSRIHYVDIRMLPEDIQYMADDFIWLCSNILRKDYNIAEFCRLNQYRITSIFSILENSDYESFTKYFINQITENKLLKKELDKSFMTDKIYNYTIFKILEKLFNFNRNNFNIVISVLKSNIAQNIETYNQVESYYEDEYDELYQNFVTFIQYISFVPVLLVDAYLLSRLFKKFKGIKPDTPEIPKNIIVYAGNGHIKNIASFLELLNFSKKEHITSEIYENCVDVENLNYPLFKRD